ncbi:BlaI/MecI/CopY family transcriptional regulator [Fusibacter bizertensis]|uniref:BlaI/MecI/CopY family transcriptional regulator n=1 Tax=Fusibacter bizertensis TaxID=1488331 RepID=A0ABT6N8Q8_9FIRM|nr:BlaI/MecI/CopY family transcriptional regulator [Fusibacter bizertensis]MDH8676790.1 BlaI/MecI/CopY family transcriptional regulator [Fusibacter bizertensis]
MEKHKLGEMEEKLADLIWAHAPLKTKVLIALCADAFDWKRTTTYTMLKRLCERELFAHENGEITIMTSKEAFKSGQGEQFVNENFGGSLPQFVAAFTRGKKLSADEVREIQKLIASHEEE